MSKHKFLQKFETTPLEPGTIYYVPSLNVVERVWKDKKADYLFLYLHVVFLKEKDAIAYYAYRFA
jgi:hypothetical protein